MGVWRVLPVLGLFVVFLGSSFVIPQEAFATTTTLNDQASCEAIPGAIFNLFIPVPICKFINPFVVNVGDTLIVGNTMEIHANSITNFGTIELAESSTDLDSRIAILSPGEFNNECGGVINVTGGDGSDSSSFIMGTNSILTNKGIINLTGGSGDFSGVLLVIGTVNNHGTITENPGSGDFSGIIFNFGIFNDNLPDLCSIQVDIDIKPGSDPNSINTKSMGVVPVAILGSADFDVTTIDVTTLMFGTASPVHDLTDSDTYDEHIQDVNDDGFDDLVSHYKQKEVGLCVDDTEATISGTLLDGTPFEGTDSVRPLHAPDC